MSVTFQLAMNDDDLLGFIVVCPAGLDVHDVEMHPYDRAREIAAAHTLTCTGEECAYYGPEVTAQWSDATHTDLSVNVSNENAGTLLRVLGLPTLTEDGEFGVGSTTAEDFLGRVLLAQGINPTDTGMPARTLIAADQADEALSPMVRALAGAGANVVHMGRPEGYVDERLVQFSDLARAAVAEGRDITWS